MKTLKDLKFCTYLLTLIYSTVYRISRLWLKVSRLFKTNLIVLISYLAFILICFMFLAFLAHLQKNINKDFSWAIVKISMFF